MIDENTLITAANFPRYDDIYEVLITAHEGLSLEESAKLDAKIILLMANHIGNFDVVSEAIKAAGGRFLKKI